MFENLLQIRHYTKCVTHTDRSNFNYTTGLENIMDKSIGRILVKLNRSFHSSPFESIQIPLMPAFKKKKKL